MEITASVFGIARKALGRVYGVFEKLICRRAYELSTLYHDHRVLVEARPYPLGEHLGYRLFWDEYLLSPTATLEPPKIGVMEPQKGR